MDRAANESGRYYAGELKKTVLCRHRNTELFDRRQFALP